MTAKVVVLFVFLALISAIQCFKPSFQRSKFVMMAANDIIAAGILLVLRITSLAHLLVLIIVSIQ